MALKLEIVSPTGIAWENDSVESVTLPLVDGEIQVLPGHIPFLSMLDSGALSVNFNGKTEDLAVDRGFVRLSGNLLSVLTENAIKFDDIDPDAVQNAKAAAQKALEEAKNRPDLDPEEVEKLEAAVKFAMVKLANKKRR